MNIVKQLWCILLITNMWIAAALSDEYNRGKKGKGIQDEDYLSDDERASGEISDSAYEFPTPPVFHKKDEIITDNLDENSMEDSFNDTDSATTDSTLSINETLTDQYSAEEDSTSSNTSDILSFQGVSHLPIVWNSSSSPQRMDESEEKDTVDLVSTEDGTSESPDDTDINVTERLETSQSLPFTTQTSISLDMQETSSDSSDEGLFTDTFDTTDLHNNETEFIDGWSNTTESHINNEEMAQNQNDWSASSRSPSSSTTSLYEVRSYESEKNISEEGIDSSSGESMDKDSSINSTVDHQNDVSTASATTKFHYEPTTFILEQKSSMSRTTTPFILKEVNLDSTDEASTVNTNLIHSDGISVGPAVSTTDSEEEKEEATVSFIERVRRSTHKSHQEDDAKQESFYSPKTFSITETTELEPWTDIDTVLPPLVSGDGSSSSTQSSLTSVKDKENEFETESVFATDEPSHPETKFTYQNDILSTEGMRILTTPSSEETEVPVSNTSQIHSFPSSDDSFETFTPLTSERSQTILSISNGDVVDQSTTTSTMTSYQERYPDSSSSQSREPPDSSSSQSREPHIHHTDGKSSEDMYFSSRSSSLLPVITKESGDGETLSSTPSLKVLTLSPSHEMNEFTKNTEIPFSTSELFQMSTQENSHGTKENHLQPKSTVHDVVSTGFPSVTGSRKEVSKYFSANDKRGTQKSTNLPEKSSQFATTVEIKYRDVTDEDVNTSTKRLTSVNVISTMSNGQTMVHHSSSIHSNTGMARVSPSPDKENSKRTDVRFQCTLNPEPGISCQKSISKTWYWYFDNVTATCRPFRYNGCGGNANRFYNRQSCKAYCQSKVVNLCDAVECPSWAPCELKSPAMCDETLSYCPPPLPYCRYGNKSKAYIPDYIKLHQHNSSAECDRKLDCIKRGIKSSSKLRKLAFYYNANERKCKGERLKFCPETPSNSSSSISSERDASVWHGFPNEKECFEACSP